MNNTSSMSRENKKQQLRRQIVPSNSAPRQGGPKKQEDEDSQEAVRRAHKRVVGRRLRLLAILLLAAAAAGFVIYQFSLYHQYGGYQVMWEKNLAEGAAEDGGAGQGGEFCEYVPFEGGLLKYTRDGAVFMDARGNVAWNVSYEMKDPMISVSGGYAVIADRQGTGIYICNKDGCQGQASSALPIMRVSVSAKGVVAALEEDSKASYIMMYKKDGSSLKISIKSLLENDGYPVDLSLSPNGTQLAVPFMYLENGMLRCKLVFYNFGVGQNQPDRVVGIIFPEDLKDAMVGRVRFLDEAHCVAFTDQGLIFISTRVETQPAAAEPVLVGEKIRTICYTDSLVGLVTENSEGSGPYRMRVYDLEGNEKLNQSFDFPYTSMDIDGGNIFLYNDNACQVYNMNGTLKFSGEFDFTVSRVMKGAMPGTLMVYGPQFIKEIKLQ